MRELETTSGMMARRQVIVVTGYGCNKNVLSILLVNRHGSLFNIKRNSPIINRSNRDQVKLADEVILNAKIEIGNHRYTSNSVVANCRYGVLLRMPVA